MARRAASSRTNKAGAAARARSTRRAWIATVAVLPIALLALPTTLLVVLGMIPTLVAFVVDRQPERYMPITVGSLNLCGTMWCVTTLWTGGHTIAHATQLLGDPFNWLIMYGAAGIGRLIYFTMPPLIGTVVAMRNRAEIKQLEQRQKELVAEWGEPVADAEPAL